MKTVLLIAILSASLHAQYAGSASGSTTAAAEINGKINHQEASGVPSGNCTQGKDLYTNSANGLIYTCTATNTWTPLVMAATSTTATFALFATATAGAPAYRAIAAADLPATLTSGTAITNAALTTPAITGLATGSGVATAATASTLVLRDSNGNAAINNTADGYATTVTAAGTTTLVGGSARLQYFTGTTTQTVTLPVTSTIGLGQRYHIVNNSTGAVTVNSSGGNAVVILAGNTNAFLTCILTSGTTAASWSANAYEGLVVTSGKALSVSNSITLAGTDGTTLTGPSSSGTMATLAGTETFTNKTFNVESSGNVFTAPSVVALWAGGCQATTAISYWDLPVSTPAVATCVTGTNIQKGILAYADTSGGFSAQSSFTLPPDWTTATLPDVDIYWTSTATTGNAKWTVQFICTDVAATATDDPAFPSSGNGFNTVTTAAPGTASRVQTSTITAATLPSSCVTATRELIHVRLFRDGADGSDTLGATANFVGMALTIRRAM